MSHFVYILFSKKLNRFYTGYTGDLDLRMNFHENAESYKYTAKANDWELFFTIECENKTQALNIEKHIKSMKSKVYIQNLIKYPDISKKLLGKYI